MEIVLEKRNNDELRKVSWIYIAETETRYCPVHLLKRFIQVGEHSPDSFLFRKISHTKATFKLRKQKLSYSRALELFKKQLKRIHLNPSLYGLHSLRSGGASLAASIGITDRLIMRHGRWRSEGSKNRYINESIDSLLRISRVSGLQIAARFLTFLGFSFGNSRLFVLSDVEVETYTREIGSD